MGRTKVIFHANCQDGSMAAAVAYKKFGARADYHPMTYNYPPEFGTHYSANGTVYCLDFSFPKGTIIKICASVNQLLIIDHHQKTCQELLDWKQSGLAPENFEIIFNNEKCGASLSWEYFFKKSLPPILRHIEDADLWRFTLAETEAIREWIQGNLPMIPFYGQEKIVESLHPWVELLDRESFDDLVEQGKELIKVRDEKIDQELVKTVRYQYQYREKQEVAPEEDREGSLEGPSIEDSIAKSCNVAVIETEIDVSMVGHRLLRLYPEIHFAIMWRKMEGEYRYSLRSESDRGVNVAQIASLYGGGGHAMASGITSNKGPVELFNLTQE